MSSVCVPTSPGGGIFCRRVSNMPFADVVVHISFIFELLRPRFLLQRNVCLRPHGDC